MKKYLFAALALMATACLKPEKSIEPDPSYITVGLAQDSIKTEWHKGDRISVITFEANNLTTSDMFVATESGTTAKFKGIYTGASKADIVIVYPAFDLSSNQQFESEPLNGNAGGYYRAPKGKYNYVIGLPTRTMIFAQDKDNSKENLEKYWLMTAKSRAQSLTDTTVTLKPRMSFVKLQLNAGKMDDKDKVMQARIQLSGGTPFATYRVTMGLMNPQKYWTAADLDDSVSEVLAMELGTFEPTKTATDTLVTLYVPIFQTSKDTSLAGATARNLSVRLYSNRGNYYYEATHPIPAGSQDYTFAPGKQILISSTLSEKKIEGSQPDDPQTPTYILNKNDLLSPVVSSSSGPLVLDGDLLYAGAGNLINIYDISSNPKVPVSVGQAQIKGNCRQMCVYDGKLFVTARESGVWIFSLANPKSPVLLSRYDGVELSTGLDVAGNCMFVGQRQTGVEFVDVSDPSRPQHIRAIKTNESQSVFYKDGYLYSGEWSGGEITVFKVNDLGNIQKLKTVKLWGAGDGLWAVGNRIYASTGHNALNGSPHAGGDYDGNGHDGNGHGLEIWDISDKENPFRVGQVKFDTFYKSGSDWWMNRPSGDGKTVFCGDVYNGFYVVDITDETKPKVIDSWCDTSKPKGSNHAVNSLAVGDGVLYVSCGGLYAVSCPRAVRTPRNRGTLPSNYSARYTYSLPSGTHFKAWKPTLRGAVRDAAVSPDGTALFVGCGQAGLATLKLNSNGELRTANEMQIPFAGGVSVLGNRLYVSEAEKGVGVYKIGSDNSLTRETYVLDKLGASSKYCYSYWLTTPNDNFLVSANRYAGWQFIAITGAMGTATPTFAYKATTSSNVNYNKYVSEKVCKDSNGDEYLPYATRNGLIWVKLSSSGSATPLTQITDEKNSLTEGVTEFKDGKALLTQGGYFKIIDAGGKASTQLGTTAIKSGIPRWDGGDKVLVCNYTSMRVSLYNLANINSPAEIFTEEFSSDDVGGYPEPGLFWQGKAIVPCGYQGLLMEK